MMEKERMTRQRKNVSFSIPTVGIGLGGKTGYEDMNIMRHVADEIFRGYHTVPLPRAAHSIDGISRLLCAKLPNAPCVLLCLYRFGGPISKVNTCIYLPIRFTIAWLFQLYY